jgi:hypothetical protein
MGATVEETDEETGVTTAEVRSASPCWSATWLSTRGTFERNEKKGGGGRAMGRSLWLMKALCFWGNRGAVDHPAQLPTLALLPVLPSPNHSVDDIRRLFDKYGDVKDVYIPMNFHTK